MMDWGTYMAEEPLTENLLDELLSAETVTDYLKEAPLQQRTASDYLNELLEEKGLVRSKVVRDASLNDTYGYQIFTGARNPSRDKLLQIAFAMRLSLRETNRLLKCAGLSDLYCKNRRDAIIAYCLEHDVDLMGVNDQLYNFNEETLC